MAIWRQHQPDIHDPATYFYAMDERRKLGLPITEPPPIFPHPTRQWTKREMEDMVKNREFLNWIWLKMKLWAEDGKVERHPVGQ